MNDHTKPEIQPLVYNSVEIETQSELISLTNLWSASGGDASKRPANWLSLATTRGFIEAVQSSVEKSYSDIIVTQKGGSNPGTWAHWQVGLAYMKYLSHDFHMWDNQIIRDRMENKLAIPASPTEMGLPDFNNPIASAEAWIAAQKNILSITHELEEAAPKIEAYENFISAQPGHLNLTRSIKVVGHKPNLGIKALRKAKVLYGTPATPTQYYENSGYFVMRPVEDRNQPGKIRSQTFVTPKGLDWLRKRLPEFLEGATQ